MVFVVGDKPENEPQEQELWTISKQLVEKVILQAVQQYSQERKHREKKTEAKRDLRLQVSNCSEQQERKK
ncbi:A-kinase anchor protein inhibitor 1-like [Chiloscyllium plagiosum]|uniref:A-kinase anchor protein inhibitor 1-like n=1 Tax=Chiloscyllium plagiosum TaxID=36176 RepID=UPI001CB7B474|nr:A-kinase anchor protein inhibitor 1-like [Chiloscyllium plagiosum]